MSTAPTVIAIGNGPSIAGAGLGPFIDSHDTVIRFNNYRTAGHEPDVGTRTTHWVTCGYKVAPRDTTGLLEILMPLNGPAGPGWEKHWSGLVAEHERTGIAIARLSPALIGRIAAGAAPKFSAGAAAIGYYLEQFPHLHIAGFDHFDSTTHHYFEDRPRDRHCPHNGTAEAAWFARLEAAGRLTRHPQP